MSYRFYDMIFLVGAGFSVLVIAGLTYWHTRKITDALVSVGFGILAGFVVGQLVVVLVAIYLGDL